MKTIEEILGNTKEIWRIFVMPEPCWEWQRAKDPILGYGRVYYQGKYYLVHRLLYSVFVEPIPKEKVSDHLCANPPCCNPTHIDPTSQGNNVRRGIGMCGENSRATHCPAGHPYDEANTYTWKLKSGELGRRCRECNRIKQAECAARRISGVLLAYRPSQTHCEKGHPFDSENTGINKTSGQRYCKTCRRLYMHEYYLNRKPAGRDQA